MPVTPSDYKLKVVLGIPFSGRYVPPEWAVALATLQWPMNLRYAYVPVNCSRHDPPMTREEAREAIVDMALERRAQYVLMLDDDVHPPPDFVTCLIRELDSRPEFDIIGGVYPSRSTAPEPVVFRQREMGASWDWKQGDIFEVAEIGTGCLLMRTSLFASLPKPWFRDLNTLDERLDAGTLTQSDVDEGVNRGAMTDDIYFCRKATDAGHRILAHGGVICLHWGRKRDYYQLPPDSAPFQKPDLSKLDARIRSAASIQGWMTFTELEWLATQAESHKEIVEIGSWMGRSSRALAENTKGRLLCVDTWNGSHEHLALTNGNGPDAVFDEFRMNMLGLDNVHAMRLSSVEAAHQVPESVKFDMCFIDGAHDYMAVCQDIQLWRSNLASGALLCGHDYCDQWPEVKHAVDEMVPRKQVVEGTSIWYEIRP